MSKLCLFRKQTFIFQKSEDKNVGKFLNGERALVKSIVATLVSLFFLHAGLVEKYRPSETLSS